MHQLIFISNWKINPTDIESYLNNKSNDDDRPFERHSNNVSLDITDVQDSIDMANTRINKES